MKTTELLMLFHLFFMIFSAGMFATAVLDHNVLGMIVDALNWAWNLYFFLRYVYED